MAGGEYSDDPTIDDAAFLWRRVPPWHVTFDSREQRWRPSSAAFDDKEMSVVLAVESRGSDSVLTGHEGYGLVAITAGLARQRGQVIARDPTDDEPAHAVVVGRKADSTLKAFARSAIWIVRPPAHATDEPPA